MAAVRTIVIKRVMHAPPSYVFDSIADPALLAELTRAVRRVTLLREGAPVPFGTGALRRVDLGPMFLEEEVTGYDRPRRFDYIIRRARPPLDHRGGTLAVEPAPGGGSRVTWSTSFAAGVPLTGPVIGAVLKAMLGNVLRLIDRRWRAAGEPSAAPVTPA